MRVLVVIPAYNEEKNLKRVMDNFLKICPQFDYIIINDGSTDGTEEICRQNQYHHIRLPVNLGISGAVQTGMKYASQKGYDMVLQFDADGQHLPEYIQDMVDYMVQEKCNVVIASRYYKSKMPFGMRTIGAKLITAAIWLTTGKYLSDPTSGMRLYDKRIIEQFVKDENNSPEPDTLSYLMCLGADVREIKVKMEDRTEGKSYLTPVNASKYMIHMLMSICIFQWFRDRKVVL
ncbi:MAG: glycosyltransferase family 2 protein [Frisingicoccus sp.]|uniref:glycosyltransferase family 2 protein n=1 Tax=Frisingicoccus sp. TaxID=1918627 RepID=UPI002A7FBEB1|nr:glycosyltransferase family 2 protein [Frisingicoccus sp.]MDY4834302.1 glycosyltransferase family 2 protein [Frisingicoccus sp.]